MQHFDDGERKISNYFSLMLLNTQKGTQNFVKTFAPSKFSSKRFLYKIFPHKYTINIQIG